MAEHQTVVLHRTAGFEAWCPTCKKALSDLRKNESRAMLAAQVHQRVMSKEKCAPVVVKPQVRTVFARVFDFIGHRNMRGDPCWNHGGWPGCVCADDCKRCSGCQCTCECYICKVEDER